MTESAQEKPMINFFLDSGAYSAMTKGAEIDIDKYIQFIRDNEGSIEMYANLDVIGDAEATHKNLKYMEAQGMNPLPVYHAGEPMHYLEEYVANYDYVCLGGAAGRMSGDSIRVWLDRLWGKYLTDDEGMPLVKVHGFGITAFPLMFRYPWASVDSTSWIRSASFGNILVAKPKVDGSPDFEKPPYVVSISKESPDKENLGQHYDNMTPRVQAYIREQIEKNGFDLAACKESYHERARVNVQYFLDFQDLKTIQPFKHKQSGFFHRRDEL